MKKTLWMVILVLLSIQSCEKNNTDEKKDTGMNKYFSSISGDYQSLIISKCVQQDCYFDSLTGENCHYEDTSNCIVKVEYSYDSLADLHQAIIEVQNCSSIYVEDNCRLISCDPSLFSSPYIDSTFNLYLLSDISGNCGSKFLKGSVRNDSIDMYYSWGDKWGSTQRFIVGRKVN